MSRLLLVRHGQSTWNAEERWQGHADPPLSDLGERQARAAAPSVVAIGATVVVSSDLTRARQTAELLAPPTLTPVVEPSVRERDVGDGASVGKGIRRCVHALAGHTHLPHGARNRSCALDGEREGDRCPAEAVDANSRIAREDRRGLRGLLRDRQPVLPGRQSGKSDSAVAIGDRGLRSEAYKGSGHTLTGFLVHHAAAGASRYPGTANRHLQRHRVFEECDPAATDIDDVRQGAHPHADRGTRGQRLRDAHVDLRVVVARRGHRGAVGGERHPGARSHPEAAVGTDGRDLVGAARDGHAIRALAVDGQ